MAKKDLKKGIFITFEGPEGCGKSTHAARVARELIRKGYPVVLTREPGGTAAGELVRDIILHKTDARLSRVTELMLFEAARSQIVSEIILPALRDKSIVICDRFNDSTVAYQGYAGNIPLKDIRAVDLVATGGLTPGLTVLLDVDADVGLNRAAGIKAKDRMESRSSDFHRAVRRGFLTIAKKNRRRFAVVSVREDPDATYALVEEAVMGFIRKNTR